MPRDRERQQTVQEGVAFMRERFDDPNAPDDGIRIRSLAEGLALLAADARAAGIDEGLAAEMILRACDFHRDTLNEARRFMAALGYVQIGDVLKRLARTAPRRVSFEERMRRPAA
ncbi:hypothetical protein [Bradyrhizobium symbiodeficiens]|uniref:hypothetical protein n=1 Tax=Bradyrhizobium symbiodeficiens TaxID=1404367 RepID=UPI000BA1B04B|nr:hypothetical protein [Bradyrhizobium symbiodeficiens]AWM07635.1 hypothetical protein CIT39_15055 [Bradyrhizobium symbiodeficiens]